jgi:hypothetical protein
MKLCNVAVHARRCCKLTFRRNMPVSSETTLACGELVVKFVVREREREGESSASSTIAKLRPASRYARRKKLDPDHMTC